MGGVAYIDWTARRNVTEALKGKHLRQMNFSDGCYKARPHIVEMGLHRDDEYTTTNLMELAQVSCTCEMLDPEEMMIQAEEAYLEEYEAILEAEHTAKVTDETETYKWNVKLLGQESQLRFEHQEPEDPSLSEFFAEMFGVTPSDIVDRDEQYHGICCKKTVVQYRKSRVFEPARKAALLSA